MTAPNNPNLYIMTREDGRKVYHLGSLGPLPANGNPASLHHLAPYTDGAMNFTLGHYWNSQATDRTNCQLVIRKSPADIVAARRMFAYGDTGAPYDTSYFGRYAYAGPMDPAGILPYMPTTGERPDIGLISDPSSYFMLGHGAVPMLAWAQGAGSFPYHYRDEATGGPVDLLKYPQANCYESPVQGSPWMPRFPLNPDGSANIGGGLYPQQAHFPEMSYLAHVATGDLGLLEELQYAANFTVLCDAIHSTPTKATLTGELRGISWGWRNLLMAHVATQDLEAALAAAGKPFPGYLHPSSYFRTLLNNSLDFFKPAMTDPGNQVFRLVTGAGNFSPWQCDYMLTVLAFAVLTGHSDLAPLFMWAFKNVYDRALGDQGYPLGMGGGSYFDGTKPSWTAAVADMYVQERAQGDARFTDEQLQQLIANPFNNYTTIYDGSYHLNTRAVLVMGQYLHKLGLVDMSVNYPRLDECFANVDRFVRNGGYIVPRASVVLDASQAPGTLDPLPPPIVPPPVTPPANPNQPPTENPNMPDNLDSLKAAVETIKADVAAEIKAVHDRIVAIIAAATGTGVSVDPAELQAQVDALNTLHQTLTTDTAALPTATA